MELKDVILSTLAELEDGESVPALEPKPDMQRRTRPEQNEIPILAQEESTSDEKQFLQSIQERLLVLFEGFQSPNNTKIEAKVDLTLNFLEYLLASVENRINILESKEKR